MFSSEEQETFVNYDYAAKVAFIYTTKDAVFEKVLQRTAGIDGRKVDRVRRTISVPLSAMRPPHMCVRTRKRAKSPVR